MTAKEKRSIAAVREKLGELDERYTNPRELEGDLDEVASALRRLPPSVTGLSKVARSHELCAVLLIFAEANLLSQGTISYCQSLRDLSELADYDVADEEEFANQCEEMIPPLKEKLEELLTKLESKD